MKVLLNSNIFPFVALSRLTIENEFRLHVGLRSGLQEEVLVSFFSTCGLSSVDRVNEGVGGTDKLLRRRGDCQEMYIRDNIIPRSDHLVHFRR